MKSIFHVLLLAFVMCVSDVDASSTVALRRSPRLLTKTRSAALPAESPKEEDISTPLPTVSEDEDYEDEVIASPQQLPISSANAPRTDASPADEQHDVVDRARGIDETIEAAAAYSYANMAKISAIFAAVVSIAFGLRTATWTLE